MWKCPHCEAKIDRLDYRVDTMGTEYGTADLTSRSNIEGSSRVTNHEYSDSGDTEWSGDVTYECSECNDELDLDDLIWVPEEETKIVKPKPEEEPIETTFNIIRPQNEIIKNEIAKDSRNSTLLCKECNYMFIGDNQNNSFNSDILDCPKCGVQNSIREFKELLEQGHFNIQKHVTKKTTH